MLHRFCVVVAAAAFVVAPGVVLAESDTEKPLVPVPGEDAHLYSCKNIKGEIAVSFKPETDLKELVTWAMGFTCKDFMFDPRIVMTGKKVTLIVPNKMGAPEAYRVFLVALSTIGLTVVPKGNVMRIVESQTAKKEAVPLYKNGEPEDTDQYVRYVIRPIYVPGDTLVQAFAALKSDAGDVQLVGTILLVTDYASHVREMMSLATLVDVPSGTDGIYTIPVLHADATKVSETVGSFIGSSAPASPPGPRKAGEVAAAAPSKVVVDARTNTLILAASDAAYKRVKALVERLDIALDIEGGTTFHVYRLGNAIAEELAKTLNDSIQGQKSPAATTPAKPAPPPAPTASPDAVAIEGQVHVIGDKPTNSLIVMSSGRDFLAIKEMIKELDQPRKQVFIETLILEVDVNNDNAFGFLGHGAIPTDGGGVAFGGLETPDLKTTNLTTVAAAGGLIGGLFGSNLMGSTLLGTSFPSYGLMFQALANQTKTNVMSAPSMIALDNEETKYKVGTDIPFKRGVLPTIPTSPITDITTNIDRKPLVLELDIKPHISNDDSVLLEVKHSAEDIDLKDFQGLGPSWTTRSFETRVVVRDQQTVVIGGLLQEREYEVATKIPVLGDIPVLGTLFRHTTKNKRKTNLLIMLTPYIIKDQVDLQKIQERKSRQHDELVASLASLDRMRYEPKIDYGRKRGLIEEINRAVIAADADAAARDALHKPATVEGGLIKTEPSP